MQVLPICTAVVFSVIGGVVPIRAADYEIDGRFFGQLTFPIPQGLTVVRERVLSDLRYERLAPYAENDPLRISSRAVGLLHIALSNGSMTTCTAALLSSEYAITNNHCIPGSGSGVSRATFMLDFLFHDQLDLVKSFDVDIEPIETNVELDYSIIQVKGGAYDEFGGILESPAGDSQFREVRAPNDREGLLIFHHPLGLPKYVTRGGCRAAGTATSDGLVFHLCATEGGSSGAPIFSSDGALVGLHIGTTAGDDFNLAVPFNDIVERSPLIQQLLDLTPRRSINNEEVPTHFESNKAVKFARFAVYNGQVKSTEESAVLSAISHFYGENNRKQDFEEAATWFHSAARSGDPFAQAALGDLYVEGLGVEKDYEEAARWYRLAADQGNKVAQFLLGEFYEFGSGGVGTNFKKAANLFRLSAVQGYAPAQHDLASLYTRSIVATPHDDKDAIEWLLAAAEQDYLPAQLDLGWAYEKGIGVEPSAEKAISWYLRAGESGDFDPKDTVDRLRQ